MANKSGKKKVKIFRKKKTTPETKIIEELCAKYDTIDEAAITTFEDLPLSSETQKGLKDANYIEPLPVQKQSISLALRGEDILGAAKTGSGKTLAFLIPVLELLYRERWTRNDGLGALIITPTRELAYQIFETLRKVGKYHSFSAGLIIGGQNLHFEKSRINQCNIIICTPGRLLDHMDKNGLLDCITMKILVLDEADRILDIGFQKTMNDIIENLPPERQTLLFSATQTKSVEDLARLSLKNPVYVSVHEYSQFATPKALQQSYIVCNLEDKMAVLWTFIQRHIREKIIVFFMACKQVSYTYDAFRSLEPHTHLVKLYGTMKQPQRMQNYESFNNKERVVLFATDVASRGLDFKNVHWVVQMDCPEDVKTYIHRVGRTARYQCGGNSLLVLLPSEMEMINKLNEQKIPIKKSKLSPNDLRFPQKKLENNLVRNPALKDSATATFKKYFRSVSLMKDKSIFKVDALDRYAYARSLGLIDAPRLRALEKMEKNAKKKSINNGIDTMKSGSEVLTGKMLSDRKPKDEKLHSDSTSQESSSDDEDDDHARSIKMNKSQNDGSSLFNVEISDDEDLLTLNRKKIHVNIRPNELPKDYTVPSKPASSDRGNDLIATPKEAAGIADTKNKKAVTKAAIAKKILRKKIVPNKKITFDEEGQELIDGMKTKISELAREYEHDDSSGINIDIAKQILREEDKFDKQLYRAKIKEKHREQKRKLKEKNKKVESEEEDEQEDQQEEGKNNEEEEIYNDSDSGSESDGPDLSWLPDPDKIYGPKKDSSDEEAKNYDSEQSENEQPIHRPPKRKLITQHNVDKKKQKIKKIANTDLATEEELALQLLRN